MNTGFMSILSQIKDLKANVMTAIIGQEDVVDHLMISLLCNGNLLIEGLPGLAKTRAIKALSSHIDCDFNRIQFAPDLTARDITGQEVLFTHEDGRHSYKFDKGPIFANLVLADEVNRAPAKAQSCLLEAMEERQVTVAAVTHKLPKLFMVMATMNPSTQHGTNPMAEAQMDRFMMHVRVDYPDEESEVKVLQLVRGEEKTKVDEGEKPRVEKPKMPQETIFQARSEIDEITISPQMERYIVDLVFATRYPERYSYQLKSCIAEGVSPRGSLALDRAVRAHAWFSGNSEVQPENIAAMIHSCLRHRIPIPEDAKKDNVTSEVVIDELLKVVKIP
jgi:MoxR-like ATPase